MSSRITGYSPLSLQCDTISPAFDFDYSPSENKRYEQQRGGQQETRTGRLLDRFTKQKPAFKPYKFDLSIDLHERLEKLANETGMTKEAINDALNYAVRSLVTRLEREARASSGAGEGE